MTKFKNLSTISAFIWLALFVVLLIIPQVVFILFNVQEHNSAFFISRRAALLFLGLSVLNWSSRNATHSESRQAICLGIAVSMLALAILGTSEYLRGFVGLGIFLAIITEVVIGTSFLKIWLNNKDA